MVIIEMLPTVYLALILVLALKFALLIHRKFIAKNTKDWILLNILHLSDVLSLIVGVTFSITALIINTYTINFLLCLFPPMISICGLLIMISMTDMF